MKKPLLLLPLFLTLLFATSGCDLLDQDSYQEYIMIESYAYAGLPYPDILITRTMPADVAYSEADAAISEATVRLSKVGENGETTDIVEYIPSDIRPGWYLPSDPGPIIQAEATYRFDIDIPENEHVRAETTIPALIEFVGELPAEVPYRAEKQLELVLNSPPQSSTGTYYLFNSTALEPSMENLTPFYLASVEGDDETDYTDYIVTNSGLISENNFDRNSDGTITFAYPWIGVTFYGPNQLVAYSVDKNTYDLVRTQSVQLGGSNLSPGEIPNVIYNVEGALGIFGSMSADTVYTSFVRP